VPCFHSTADRSVWRRPPGHVARRPRLAAGMYYHSLAACGWWRRASTSNVRHVELKVTSLAQGDHIVVSVNGEIDLYTVPRLQRELAAALASAKPARLVVDLSGVDFCDSTGVNVLLAAHRQAREAGGDLELAAPRPAVRKILQVTGLEAVFTVTDSPAQSVGR
jgi:anti-sigma B factor antagonist